MTALFEFLDQPFWRYVLELSMVLPGAILCLLPLHRYCAGPKQLILLVALTEALFVIFFGARLGVRHHLASVLILLLSVMLFFPSLMIAFDLALPKLVFTFIFAMMLCVLADTLTFIISAPWEQDALMTFSPRSSLLCLGVAFALALLLSHTLYRKLPDLFEEHQLDALWLPGILIVAFCTALFFWQTVDSTYYAADRVLRVRSLVLLGSFPLLVLLLFQLLWWFGRRLHDEANLTQENSLLRMESKRFTALSRYLNETRTLRHDFRQHLRVLNGLAHAGRLEELKDYLASLDEAQVSMDRYCANPTVDALCAHYAEIAAAQATRVDWALELPEELKIRSADFCAVLGNLVENALQAVEALPEEQRHVRVVTRMLSDQMVGILVENPYKGRLRLRSDGLPAARRKGQSHGIGLRSVAATVRRNRGSMDVDFSDGVFRVNVLMYTSDAGSTTGPVRSAE